jgi:hypothetical protein
MVLRRVFGPNGDRVMGESLDSGEHHNLYSSPNIIRQIRSRRMRGVGHVACMREDRKVYKVLVAKPKGKRRLRRLRHRWEDGIKVDHRQIGWEGMEWIYMAEDRDQWQALVNTVMYLWVMALHSYLAGDQK